MILINQICGKFSTSNCRLCEELPHMRHKRFFFSGHEINFEVVCLDGRQTFFCVSANYFPRFFRTTDLFCFSFLKFNEIMQAVDKNSDSEIDVEEFIIVYKKGIDYLCKKRELVSDMSGNSRFAKYFLCFKEYILYCDGSCGPNMWPECIDHRYEYHDHLEFQKSNLLKLFQGQAPTYHIFICFDSGIAQTVIDNVETATLKVVLSVERLCASNIPMPEIPIYVETATQTETSKLLSEYWKDPHPLLKFSKSPQNKSLSAVSKISTQSYSIDELKFDGHVISDVSASLLKPSSIVNNVCVISTGYELLYDEEDDLYVACSILFPMDVKPAPTHAPNDAN